MTRLTNKQKAFIEEYLRDFNATQAAKRAGYQGNTNTLGVVGCNLLKKQAIVSAIETRVKEVRGKTAAILAVRKIGKRKKRKAHSVYLIREEHGLIKIGKASDVDERLKQLRTAIPYNLTILGIIESANAAAIERTLHYRYRDKRKQGEWFQLSDYDISDILNHEWHEFETKEVLI